MAHIKTGANSIVHILYHYPCTDGAFSALAAYLRFRNRVKSLTFVPHSVHTPLDINNFPTASHAYLLDYIGGNEFPFQLAKRVEKVTVIDHHKTAIEYFDKKEIPENMHVNFAYDKSGATLALDHFSKEVDLFDGMHPAAKEKIKNLFSYVEDNDLWTLKLPSTRHFSSGLHSLQIQYNQIVNPNVFEQLMRLNVPDLIQKGKEVSLDNDAKIMDEISKSFAIKLGGHEEGEDFGKCLAVISTFPDLRSSIGHELATKSNHLQLRAIGCIVYTVPERPAQYKVSMRSIDEDTTVVSKKYGGGGHREASSFFISIDDFEKWKVDNQ